MARFAAEFDAELVTGVARDPELRPVSMVSWDFAAHDRQGWTAMVSRMAEDRDVLLSAGSRRRRGFGSCHRAGVLWARVEGKRQALELLRFRPSPTIVLREGSTSRRTALWALRQPLSGEWLDRANRRVAHKLFAAKKWGVPEFEFHAPGSCLRVGRARPVPVRTEWFDPTALFMAREVVGQLREAPNPNAWRQAVA
jgi:hypothetical protein